MARILLIIRLILVVLWLLGVVAFHITTPMLHTVIVIGLILIIIDLVNTRRNWY